VATREVEGPERIVDLHGTAEGDGARKFRVVLICTGNRCRSPIAEALLRRYAAGLPVSFSSAGVLDVGALAVPDELVEAASRLGLELGTHRARTMKGLDLTEADLVVGFEWGHVAAAVVEGRAPYERTFTLKGLVRLLDGNGGRTTSDPVKNAKRMVAIAHGRRGSLPGYDPEDNIADPFGGPIGGYLDMLRTTDELCSRVLTQLFASNGPHVIRIPEAAALEKWNR
jgi:protein-tyrosine phosphatase